LTICVEDCKDASVKIEDEKVHFKGTGGDKHVYECTMVPHAKLIVSDSKYVARDRSIEMLLRKNDRDGPYWPRLLKDTSKVHWLKVDFNKWKDEDDSGDEDMAGGNFEEMMRQMGGFGGGGGDALGGMDEGDSDDEDLPDLEPADKPEEKKDNKQDEKKE